MNSWKQTQIKAALDRLYLSYHADFHNSPSDFFERRRDPILFPHRYNSELDMESAAFIASTFAYGNVTSLCAFVDRLLGMMAPSPYAFLMNPSNVETLESSRPYYRLQKSREILGLLKMLSCVYRLHGSLYNVFMQSYDTNNTIKIAASNFVRELSAISGETLAFLVPSPASGSPCKRLMLFFRWMVRRDGIDFGLWEKVSPASLVVPVDTHIGRVAYRLGWIKTRSLTWQKAEEITAALRKFDPADPIRYDFSLCHESMRKSDYLDQLLKSRKIRQ
jgi:uncharacterized protein (TIGR02757 family)